MSLEFFEGQLREFFHQADGEMTQTEALTFAAGADGPVT